MGVSLLQRRSSPVRSQCTVQAYLACALAILLLADAAVFLFPQGASGSEPEMVARVNGSPVTRGDLERLLDDPLEQDRLRQEFDSRAQGPGALERLALQTLIHRHLFLQEAERRSLTVTEEELNRALSVLRSRFKDLSDFGVWMRARGLDDKSLFETVRDQIRIKKTWAALVAGVRLDDSEMRAYYADHKQDLTLGEQVRLRIIAVQSADTAREILETLRKGASFSRLAQQRSEGLRAGRGGDTGWVDASRLPPHLQQAVQRLQVGDVAGPLQKNSGEFLIVGLVDRRPVQPKSPAQARPAIERRLLPAKRQETIQAWLTEQKAKANIEVLLAPNKSTTHTAGEWF